MEGRFDRVNSAEPCRGRNGLYQVWLHTVPFGVGPAQPSHLEVAQVGEDCAEIDERLELPAQPGIGDMFRIIRYFDAHWGRRHIHPHQIVTMSLIRVCNRARHEGGPQAWTGADRGWLEAVTRTVLLPPGSKGIPQLVPERRIAFGVDGVSDLAFTHNNKVLVRPIVSVPVTIAEQNESTQVAVPVSLRTDPALGAFALLHMQGEGMPPIERVFKHAT